MSDAEAEGAARDAETARRTLHSLGLGSSQVADMARQVHEATAAVFGEQQEMVTRAARAQKAIAVGLPAAGLVTGSAWGVSRISERWAKTWPSLVRVTQAADRVQEAIQPMLGPMSQMWDELARNAGWIKTLRDAWLAALPANVRDVERLSLSALCDFLAVEGIPLYLIPRCATVEAFLAAPDHAAVRQLLSTRAGSIAADCMAVWARYRNPKTEEWIRLLEAGQLAYRGGHAAAAQALFANVLDSVTFAMPAPDRRRYTRHKWGDADYEHLLEEDLATALAIMPLWRVHEENWAGKGHDVPREFNRHATLHRASARQYTKRNAIQAMMLATSLVAWFAEYGVLVS